jgi:DNA repair ATPase RecN
MAAELKRLLAERRQQWRTELESRLAAERRALAERNSFDLSVRLGPCSDTGLDAVMFAVAACLPESAFC